MNINHSIFFLYICNFLYIGSLPIIFFKKGHKNIKWWLTAAPFFLCTFFLAAAYAGFISPLIDNSKWQIIRDSVAILLSISSISLISYTIGGHRIPLNLWHQSSNQPDRIVTYGAYQKIRHPFYSAFLLALLGTLIFFPHVSTLFTLIYGILALRVTAIKEERNLIKYDSTYKNYMKTTGRFLPKIFNLKL